MDIDVPPKNLLLCRISSECQSLFPRETEQYTYFGGVKDLVLVLRKRTFFGWEGMLRSPVYLLRNPFRLLHAANKGDRKEEMGNVHVEKIVVQFS